MERKTIPEQYYRDSKCETIESVIRESPRYVEWRVMRFQSVGGLSDYEDSFEIQNERGKPVISFSESEIDLLISTDTLQSVLDSVRRFGFFLRFSPRTLKVAGILVSLIPFVILIPVAVYLMSLPVNQTLPAIVGISMVYLFYIVILVLSRRSSPRNEPRVTFERNIRESYMGRAGSIPFERLKELDDLKRNNPMEYIRRLRELTDEQNRSSLEQDD
ncbi:MAG: hypothetical protein ACFFFD_14255 [Promethearchaeota archaeon]